MQVGDKVKLRRDRIKSCIRSWRTMAMGNTLISYYRGTHEIVEVRGQCVVFKYGENRIGKAPYEEWTQPTSFVVPVMAFAERCQNCSWQHCRGKHATI